MLRCRRDGGGASLRSASSWSPGGPSVSRRRMAGIAAAIEDLLRAR
jgi:hypothetical protein